MLFSKPLWVRGPVHGPIPELSIFSTGRSTGESPVRLLLVLVPSNSVGPACVSVYVVQTGERTQEDESDSVDKSFFE